jgi:hypothetical protein
MVPFFAVGGMPVGRAADNMFAPQRYLFNFVFQKTSGEGARRKPFAK